MFIFILKENVESGISPGSGNAVAVAAVSGERGHG